MEGHVPRDLQLRAQLPQDHVAQDLGTVVVVLGGVLHEAEAIDVTNNGLAIGSQQVKATHSLLKGQANCPCNQLFLIGQNHRVSDLKRLKF